MLFTALAFFALLAVVVLVHEFGHFITAIWCGAKAEEFGFGFPPRLLGWYKIKSGAWRLVWGRREVTEAVGTVYSLNWLPLGGFVRIKGENGEEQDASDSFASRKIWQRAVILVAGVLMNIILAWVLLSVVLGLGATAASDDVPQGATVIRPVGLQVGQVLPNTPAAAAGVHFGDVLISVNGQTFTDFPSLKSFTQQNKDQNLIYDFRRGSQDFTAQIKPQDMGAGDIGIGMAIDDSVIVRYPWWRAPWEGLLLTGRFLEVIAVGLFNVIAELFRGHNVGQSVAGPLGIANLTGQVARLGLVYFLQFAAMISLNLAIINILPFPALDGGRLLFLAIEKIKGSPLQQNVEAWANNIGFALLMLAVVLVTCKDLAGLGGIFGKIFVWFK